MTDLKIVCFVGNHDYRLAGTTQQMSHPIIQVGKPVHYVNNKKNHVGFFHRDLYLLVYFVLHYIVGIDYPAAGID